MRCVRLLEEQASSHEVPGGRSNDAKGNTGVTDCSHPSKKQRTLGVHEKSALAVRTTPERRPKPLCGRDSVEG
ncbi:hypothetical protein Hypma_005188 [Hypsizygus marmoreus]|uniref:Uncharacterized protein n=1 Tax=Hypsizygus marmoreus TaxID=39966 RepID=A0A369IZG9_HYPMA|nr:hypothetical protein Hypma_005188 [Hypsizygus marmoreus]